MKYADIVVKVYNNTSLKFNSQCTVRAITFEEVYWLINNSDRQVIVIIDNYLDNKLEINNIVELIKQLKNKNELNELIIYTDSKIDTTEKQTGAYKELCKMVYSVTGVSIAYSRDIRKETELDVLNDVTLGNGNVSSEIQDELDDKHIDKSDFDELFIETYFCRV